MNLLSGPLCSRWGSFLLMGIFLVILGTIALSSAFIITMATVMLFGAVLIAAGVYSVIHAFWAPEWKGFFVQLIVGILSSVVGWLIISSPIMGALSLTLLLAAYFFASGLFKIAASLMLEVEHWGWLLLSGITSLILGVLVFAQWPASSLWIIGLFIAIDLMISGWTNVMFSLMLRKRCKLTEPKTAPKHETMNARPEPI